jgi:hypothetical protein
MVRGQALLVALIVLCGGTAASAQDIGAGAGTLEAGFFPGGGTFFVGGDDDEEVDFNTYNVGGFVSWYLNRLAAVEGEGSFGIGIAQDVIARNRFFEHIHVPHTFSFSGNVLVFPAGADRRLAPYVTGGVGVLSLRERGAATRTLGFTQPEGFFATNFGGGAKLFRGGTGLASWGVRFDYRIFLVGSRDDAAPFFANRERRKGHRVYLGFQYIVRR